MWKRRKFKKRAPLPLLKIFLLIFIPLIFVLIFFSIKKGFLNIKQIEVQGRVSCADESELKNISGLSGSNFFLVDASKIGDKLRQKFFCIKSAFVSKTFPDKINLQIFGRVPLAVLATLKAKESSSSGLVENMATPSAQQVQDYYLVDGEGVVFGKGTTTLNIPQIFLDDFSISLGGKLTNEISGSLKILEQLKVFGIEAGNSLISGDTFVITPKTQDQKIIFRLNDKIDIQLASLQLILDKAKINLTNFEFIDLRFDKPVVKFAPKK